MPQPLGRGVEVGLASPQLGHPDITGSDDATDVMALVEEWEMIELELLGGKGPTAPEREPRAGGKR
jgi:hypothetical protein